MTKRKGQGIQKGHEFEAGQQVFTLLHFFNHELGHDEYRVVEHKIEEMTPKSVTTFTTNMPRNTWKKFGFGAPNTLDALCTSRSAAIEKEIKRLERERSLGLAQAARAENKLELLEKVTREKENE